MTSARRVAQRYRRAADDEAALDALADHWADVFFDTLEAEVEIDEDDVTKAIETLGISEEHLDTLADKTAGLGDLWSLVMSPFVAIKKLIMSQAVRDQIKKSFKRALSHEVRSSRHVLEVAGRLARGEPVRAPERQAAMRQLVSVLSNAALFFLVGPGIANLGVWKALGLLAKPLKGAIALVLDKPLKKAAKRLLDSDIGDVPSLK